MSEPIRTPNENPSRVEEILSDTIGLPGYEIEPPRSRIETLLISLDGSIAANVIASIDPSTYVLTLTLKNKNGGTIGTPSTIDLPLEATVVGGRYDSQTKKLILTLTSGETIEIPLSDLIYGLQNEITSEDPLDADLVDDTSSDHKFVSSSDKNTWNGKQNAIDSNHKLDADLVDDSNSTNKFNVQANWTESNSSSPSFIQNKPTLGTASALDVAASGDASTTEVVKGDDSRLTDSRNAADVYSWAKQSSKPSYDYSEITNTPTIPSAGSSDPLMDGTASAGTASTYSKSDHVHPTDTSRQAVINSNNKLSADLVDDSSSTNKFATAAQLSQIETNKTNISTLSEQVGYAITTLEGVL